MARLSTTAERTVRDFAASMGLTPREAADGSFSFRFERGDVLTFTPAATDTRLLISLAFRSSRNDEAVEEQALAAARLDPTTDRVTHVGRASDGTLVLAVSAPAETIDLPTLDATLQDLRTLRASLG